MIIDALPGARFQEVKGFRHSTSLEIANVTEFFKKRSVRAAALLPRCSAQVIYTLLIIHRRASSRRVPSSLLLYPIVHSRNRNQFFLDARVADEIDLAVAFLATGSLSLQYGGRK